MREATRVEDADARRHQYCSVQNVHRKMIDSGLGRLKHRTLRKGKEMSLTPEDPDAVSGGMP